MLRLYPTVKVQGTDYSKEKVVVIPNQSMSLRDIIRRYIRGEPVKVTMQEEVYTVGLGDLEKVLHMDPVEQMERAEALKAYGDELKKRQDEADKKLADEKAAADLEEQEFRKELNARKQAPKPEADVSGKG